MLYFSCSLILRSLKISEIVILLFLMMTTFYLMPRDVWGEEIYRYTNKDGTIVITDKPPPQEDIMPDTGKSNSYQDLSSDERLHWGRDNALNDEQNKSESRQRKKVQAGSGIEAGRYEVKVKKIGSNLYQDISTRIIIKTSACIEPAGVDESVLDWSGAYGELFFKKTNKSCMVKKVYK
jgi:hypothetical protein